MRLIGVLVIVFLMSCNLDKGKQSNDGGKLSDDVIEADVSLQRNQTKIYLDFEKASQIGLKETYQHEDPYSIVFLDGNDSITFQAIKFETSEIEATINLFIDVVNLPQEIKKTLIDDFEINYVEYVFNNRKWVHSVINIDETDQRVMMQISSEQIISAEELLREYLIVRRNRK